MRLASDDSDSAENDTSCAESDARPRRGTCCVETMSIASKLSALFALASLVAPLSGCSASDAEEDSDEEALEQGVDRFKFDPNSAKERSGEVDLQNAYSAARLSALIYDRWEDVPALRDRLSRIGMKVEELVTLHAKDSGFLASRALTGTDAFYVRTPDAAFLVFRGTEKLEDMIADMRVRGVNAGPMVNRSSVGEVHEGFYYSVKSVWEEARPLLLERHGNRKGVPLFVMGHSLGGAIGTVATHQLLFDACVHGRGAATDFVSHCVNDYIPVRALYTFGSPRTGDQDYATNLAKRLHETGTKMFRFANEDDEVTTVPRYTPSIIGVEHYRHIGTDGDERTHAILLSKDGRLEVKPRGQCADEPAILQCDAKLWDLATGMLNGHAFWRGEHGRVLYVEKLRALATGTRPELDELRAQLKAEGKY